MAGASGRSSTSTEDGKALIIDCFSIEYCIAIQLLVTISNRVVTSRYEVSLSILLGCVGEERQELIVRYIFNNASSSVLRGRIVDNLKDFALARRKPLKRRPLLLHTLCKKRHMSLPL
jgi:hypothetical protein